MSHRLASALLHLVLLPLTVASVGWAQNTPGTMQFGAATYGVDETAGTATVRVTRTGTNLASGVTVQLTTTNGTATAPADYLDATQILTFAAGETFKDVPITIVDDAVADGNRTVVLTLSSPSLGARLGVIKTAVLTIRDDEQGLQFSAPTYVVSEATAAAMVTVVRTGPPVGTVTVDYASAAASATAGSDYATVSGTLTFSPGVLSRSFTVPITNDTRFEESESLALLLNNPTGSAQLGPLDAATITIIDNDVPGAVRFGAATYTVTEAMATATITVQRTPGARASAVTVDYATVDGGSATPGVDYLLTSGTLTFNAGETSKSFTVTILNDKLAEPAETVNLALANPRGGATLGVQSTAVLTITDDDVAGVITFGAPTFTVKEGAGPALIKVNRTGGAGGVTVDFTTADGTASAPGDYTAMSQTLSFAAGETSKTIAIPIAPGAGREGNETVRLILSNATGRATLGTTNREALITIVDSDTGPVVAFGAATFTVAENVAGAMASVTIVRSGSTAAGQSVLFSTADGTATAGVDYTAVASQPVTFAAGQTMATVKVPIINNTNIVGSRTVNLVLGAGGPNPIPAIGSPATAVLTILEDDSTIQFANATYDVKEGGVVTLTVTRTGGTVGPATVRYATSNGTATAPGAYVAKSGTLAFGPGVASQVITVTTIGNTIVDGPRTFTVTLSSSGPAGTVLGPQSTATVTIGDDDAPGSVQFSSATYAVAEGAAAVLTVTRTGGSAGTITVPYATADGGGGGEPATGGTLSGPGIDYAQTTGVLTFTTGVTSRTLTVPTKADTLLEGPETFTVTLSPPGNGATLGAPSSAVVTIVDTQAPRVQFAKSSYTVAESAGAVTLTVMRVGPAAAQNTVSYSVAGVTATPSLDFADTGGTLTFGPGITSRQIVIPIVGDQLNEGPETLTVTLSSPTGGAIVGAPAVATVTITDDDPAGTVQFSQASYAVIEGETATITVSRTGTSGPVTVDFATSPGSASAGDDYTGVSGTLTFLAGETSKTFTVPTTADDVAENSESVNLTLSGATNGLVVGSQSAATLWILDRQQSFQFSTATTSVVEGQTLTITVTRSGVPAGTVTVDYRVGAGGTGTAADFTLLPGPGTLTFPPGVTTRTISVQAVQNTTVGSRSVVLELLNASSGASLRSPSTTTVGLIDNDRPDLVVIMLTAPAQAAAGVPVTVFATVANVAGAAAPASSLGIFASSSSGAPGAGVQIGTIPVPPLAGGASFTMTATVTVPPALPPAMYFLSAVADAPGAVSEGSEDNNGLTAQTQVEIVQSTNPITLYVAPTGDDGNAGTAAQPWRTVEKARDTVRGLNGNMSADIRVILRGGEYVLPATVEFTAADSGSNGYSVIYQAAPGERPVLTGGQHITGWTAVGGGIYKAPVPVGSAPFRQLYANGSRAIRARTPNAGAYHQLVGWDLGGRTIEIAASEISDWQRLGQVEMVILGRGVNQGNLRIGSFAVVGGSAVVTASEPERTRIFEQVYPPKESRPYFFENALEFLDASGEWYLDTTAGEVYYMPRAGESLGTLAVVVPRDLETLVRVRGDLDTPVHHIQFVGLTFEHTTWLVPNGEGYVGDQASVVITGPLPNDQLTSYPGGRLPGAIHIEGAHHTRLERNVLRHLGGSAVNYWVGTHDNEFVGNVITDVSGSGVSVDLNLEGNPADGRKISRNEVIRNNYIEKTGRDYYQAVGIMAGYTDGVVIEHNELHDMPYSGISVGWGWADQANAAQNNVVRYNRVWDVLNTMADGGALYTLSRQPGTVLAENYVFDIVRQPWLGGYEINGMFMDEGSNLITVRDNVFQNIDDQDIRFNNNGPSNTLINNEGSSPVVKANAGLEPAYQNIRP